MEVAASLLVLSGLLLLSGAAGLIYQVAWVRLLGLSLGVTVYAISTVLAAFMAGLALGSVVGGRLADRTHHPLRSYGLIELGIGAAALLTLPMLGALQEVYRGLGVVVDPAQAPLVAGAVRLAVSFAVLLVPTALMGATLPLAVRGALRLSRMRSQRVADGEVRRDGGVMGALYALNTTGAIIGCLAAGFVLLGGVGISATVGIAAVCNALAGVGALLLARVGREGGAASDGWSVVGRQRSGDSDQRSVPGGRLGAAAGQGSGTSAQRAATGHALLSADHPRLATDDRLGTTDHPLPTTGLARTAFWAFGLSGALSLAYEVVWSRVLAILFDSTVYGFVLMLATVLLGIAVGSAVAGALVSLRPGARFAGLTFGWLEVGLGLGAVFSLAAFGGVFDLLTTLRDSGGPLFERLLRTEPRLMAMLCVVTVLPASLCMGATFPVAARLWAAGAGKLGSRLGGIYAANVAGAILGSLAGGFLLVPLFGAHTSLLLLAALNVLLGGWLLWEADFGRRWLGPLVVVAGGLLGIFWGAAQPPLHDRVFHQRFADQQLLWYREGLETTVSVGQSPDGVLRLYTNSLSQTTDAPDLVRYHQMMGHLAALLSPLHEDERRVLVVGVGGGATPGAIAEHSGTRIDLVELSHAVVEAAPFFRHINGDLLNRPNVRLIVDDGRNYLLRSRQQYDIITADIVPPTHAGATNLYSVEYFRLVARALAPNGLMVQWVSPENAFAHQLIVRSFLEAFPHATLWLSGDLLIGSPNPITLDLERLQERLNDPAARASLAAVGLNKPEDVLFHFRADAAELRDYAGPGLLLTDDRPLLEYFRSLDLTPQPAALGGFSGDERKILMRP